MQFFSLDIETTGLDHRRCQVLQVAMVREVVDGTEQPPVEELPYFETIIHQGLIWGEPFALRMNAELIHTIANIPNGFTEQMRALVDYHDRAVPVSVDRDDMATLALKWLAQYPRPWVVAGKNVSGFDLKFLPRLLTREFDYRVIDAGSVALGARPEYWHQPRPPSLKTLEADNPHPHDALEDARSVIRALRSLRHG